MNSFYPLMQQQQQLSRLNPGVILNPLSAMPTSTRTSEVLAAAVRSFLTQAIDEPSETYEQTGFITLKDYPEEVVYIGYTLLKAYLTDKMLSVPAVNAVIPGVEIKPVSFIGSGDRWAEVWRNIGTSITSKSRITKSKGGYTLSLYVGSMDIGYYELLNDSNYSATVYDKTGRYLGWEEQRNLNTTLENALSKAKATIFGKDLLDLSKSADFTIKVANPFAYVSQADFLAAEMSDEESLSAFGLLFKGFRIISPQLAGGSSANYNLFKTDTGTQHYTPDEVPAEEMDAYIKHAIYRRELEGFVTFHIPQDIAEYVTQSKGDKATKGKLGMWFFQWSANCMHPNGSGAFSEIINPLGSIAEINAPNESKATPKSNEHNLAIDNSGHIVYLPTVNKAKEYDDLYDSVGTTEDGDWCVTDIKELPGNTAPITGPRVRSEIVSRKFPENMLIYTDWINGKLSYSNTAGVLQILDIDSYSPASATTIRALLDTPLFGSSARTRAMLAAVSTFIRQYAPAALYEHLQSNKWADFKAVFGDWKKDSKDQKIDDPEEGAPPYYIASMANQLMSSAIPAFIDNLYWRMRSISSEIERNPQNPSGANATLLLDYSDMEEWTVKEFSMSSSLPALHCIGYALKVALENAFIGDADTLTERLFTGRSVLSNMADLGITIGIARYVNDYEGVAIKDRANRKIYMEAKRDSKYVPKPVPLVKDRYFLPHQAKNAAILDQKPKNAILSVSAGGGKCQVGDTLVPTSKGLLRLDEIWEKGKGLIDEHGFKPFVSTVISHTDELVKTDKIYHTTGKTWRVTFSDGTVVEGLPEHKYWAYKDSDFQFIRLDEFEIGDCVPKSLATNLYGSCSVIPGTDIPLGKDFAFILGYMVAEGYFGGNVDKKSMSFCNHNVSIIRHFNECWYRIFGYKLGFVVEPRLNNKVTGLWITEQSEKNLLWDLCGRGTSADRYIPLCIRQSPKLVQAAFLSALFEGDGSIYESTEYGKRKGNWTIEYTTISKDLAYQTRYMLENMGILTVLKEIDTWASNGSENQVSKRGYTIYLSHNSDAFSIFSENIGFIGAKKTNLLKQCLSHKSNLVYGQDTNRNIFGIANNFPCGIHAERCMSSILSTISQIHYVDKRGVTRYRGINTLSKLGYKTRCKKTLNKNGYTSRHWLNLLRAIICDTPKEISTALKSNKQIRSSWEKIKQVRDYVWISVLSVEETGVEKPVYDISVPGPNSYASNGLYSHNTIQLIVDMLRNLGDGSSKRPLVLCPGFLVKNYVEDIAYFTEGRLNSIVVNSETMRVYGEEKLRAMIKSAPPNTVVLSDYDFISRGRTSAVPYGMNSINISQNAEFLREFDFDSCLTGDTLVHTNKGTVRYDAIVGHIPVGTKQPINGWTILTKAGMKPITMGSHSLKCVYSIQTQSGIVIRGTDTHRFYVLNDKFRFEWKQVRDLTPRDTLCVERTRFAFSASPVTLSLPDVKITGNYQKSYKKPMVVTKELARFAGYMIAEGYVGKTVEFSQHDDDILADFDRLTQEIFGTVFQKYTGRRVKGSIEIVTWCVALGLQNPSKNHKVPECILQSPREIQIEFLRGYAEGDGGVDGFQVAFTSQSSLLLQQIQTMLLNIGIVSFVTYGQDARFDPPLPHNNLRIKGKLDISRFAEAIGFIGKPRSKRLRDLVDTDWDRTCSHTTRIPGLQYAYTWIKKHRGGGNGKYLCSDGAYRHKKPITGVRGQGHGFAENYDTLWKSIAKGDLLELCPSLHTHFQEIADANFFFDPIVSITKGVKEDVYDIDVKGEHTFIANGLVTHNCALDESHNLKNADSLRSQFTQRIINTIPMRRLATGTFTPNQTSDIIGQMNMLDPSIFGDLDDFIEEYSNGKVGNVFLWKDGAEKEVARRISENSALITCKRKEWQFLLPLKEEKFHFIDLTKAQRSVYDAILEEEIERIKENEKLRKKLESGDENDAEAIETMLKAYLQRVERFLAAPATDELGDRLLEGDDRISPKGLEVARLFEEHLASGDTGKILVFTSYLPSAQAIYDCLPQNLQSQTLHYTSANKANDLATFNKDPRIKFLVGVENSLKEGLNLQIASRLIRVETVWSPGALEQAESRINRPDPKNNDPAKQRAKISLDWLVVDRTIDVTKTARLISKMIKTTKFEEQNNRIYDQVPDDLDPILMTLDNITNLNSWEEHLSDYLRGYNSLKSAEKQDYDAYRANPEFSTANVPLAEGSTIQGASIMPQVPYIEAMTLPHTEELGLKSFADYVSEHSEPIDDAYKYFDASGLRVHTEYGDGVIAYSAREASLSISVLLDNGNKVSVKKLKTFIITEEKKGGVRQRLAAIANLPLRSAVKKATTPPAKQQPVVTPPKVDTDGGGRREPVPNVDTQANAKFNLYLCVVNNMASVGIDDADPDVPVATLKKLGFAFSGSYVYCAIPTARSMHTFLAKLSDEYVVPQANMTVLENLAETFTMGRKKLLNVQQASAIAIQNFWRIVKRPVPKGTIKPYPIVQDGVLYIAFWKVGQPSVSTLKTKMAGIPGVTFNESDGEYFAFFPNKAQLKDFIKGLRTEGYSIGNMDEVKEQFTAIALSRVRAAK